MEKKKIELDKLVRLAETDLDKLVATGNVKETANMVTTLALVLNDQTEEQKSKEDVKENSRGKCFHLGRQNGRVA